MLFTYVTTTERTKLREIIQLSENLGNHDATEWQKQKV